MMIWEVMILEYTPPPKKNNNNKPKNIDQVIECKESLSIP